MSNIEECREAVIEATSNISLVDQMLEELEDFDALVDHPVWGSIQTKLLGLRDDYHLAAEVLCEAPVETDEDFSEVVASLMRGIKDDLTSILLNTDSRNISINVEVKPTLH
jgi:hypothetical protein